MEPLRTFEKGNVKIVCDAFSYEKKPEISAFIESPDIRSIIEAVWHNFIMVLGGDGTMLRAVQSHHLEKLPFLGINFGTKWFLLNDRNAMRWAKRFASLEYPLIEAVVSIDGQEIRNVAMNEIQIKTVSGGMSDLTFDIGNLSRVQVKGDGILVVTPAGSTGYNQSAGGPVLPHSSHHFIVTPLLPFEPRWLRPIVYERLENVVVTNNNERKRKLSIFADSIPIIEGSDSLMQILVREFSDKIELLIADTYERTWKAKTFAEQGMEVL